MQLYQLGAGSGGSLTKQRYCATIKAEHPLVREANAYLMVVWCKVERAKQFGTTKSSKSSVQRAILDSCEVDESGMPMIL